MKQQRPSILSAGYATLDVIVHNGTISHRAGGTAANIAANLAFFGWQSSISIRLGRDAPGRRIRHDLRTAGVAVELIEQDHTVETPVILQYVRPPSHWFAFRCPECGRRLPRHRPITREHLDERVLANAIDTPDVFFFDRASAPALLLAEHVRERGSTIVFEPSAPGRPERTLKAARLAHIIKCSRQRRHHLPNDLFRPRPGQLQIETLGGNGLRYRIANAKWVTVTAPEVIVQDTAGAGDWLTAALLNTLPTLATQRPSKRELDDALGDAQRLAALSCQLVGARALAQLPLADVVIAAASDNGHRPLTSPASARSRARGVCRTCLVTAE